MQERFTLAYKLRGALMAPPVLFIMLALYRETGHHAVIWPVGLAVFTAGVALRVWAQMHLHYRLKVRKVLTMTGPYTFIRNPIYVANTTMLLGVTVLSGLLWFLPIMLVWCVAVYYFVVRREEFHLTNKYGRDYEEFLTTTPRWIPRMTRNARPCPTTRPFLWPSIRTELGCFLLVLPFVAKEVLTHMGPW